MKSITVLIGSVETTSSGQYRDHTRRVEFEGEHLGELKEGDTRGTTESLYRTADGRLLAHVEAWSQWQGEVTTYTLREVAIEDLGPTGRFAMLGAICGFGRPLTLEEALDAARDAMRTAEEALDAMRDEPLDLDGE